MAGVMVVIALMLFLPSRALGGAKVYESDDFSVELGLRMQPRMVYSRIPVPGIREGEEWQRDFLIRRARIKVSGKMLSAVYSLEWRLDATGLISGLVLTSPIAGVENAWLQWPLAGPGLEIRAGLYDQPFSRDRLTSDSKQLAVDRSLVSGVPAALGLADNAIGLDLRGKFEGGRYQYAVGVFDNRTIQGPFQDMPMFVGRLDFNFGSSKNVYRDAHFGSDSWYSLGLNGSYQASIQDSTGADDGLNAAVGADGMIDVPAGPGRLLAKAEVNHIHTEAVQGGTKRDTMAWMVGAGYLFLNQRLQPIVRFDQVHPDEAEGKGITAITHLGLNYYQRGHNLKVQADVGFLSSTGEPLDEFRLQTQIDF